MQTVTGEMDRIVVPVRRRAAESANGTYSVATMAMLIDRVDFVRLKEFPSVYEQIGDALLGALATALNSSESPQDMSIVFTPVKFNKVKAEILVIPRAGISAGGAQGEPSSASNLSVQALQGSVNYVMNVTTPACDLFLQDVAARFAPVQKFSDVTTGIPVVTSLAQGYVKHVIEISTTDPASKLSPRLPQRSLAKTVVGAPTLCIFACIYGMSLFPRSFANL